MVDGCQTNSSSKIQQPTTGSQQQKLLKKIRKCEARIQNLKTLPYYTVFNQRAEQEKDIAKAEKKLHSLQSQLAVLSMSEASINRQPTTINQNIKTSIKY